MSKTQAQQNQRLEALRAAEQLELLRAKNAPSLIQLNRHLRRVGEYRNMIRAIGMNSK